MTLDRSRAKELAQSPPESPVLSIYCLTDPRQSANTSDHPSWLTALKNGLHKLAENGAAASHEERQTLKKLVAGVPARLADLGPEDRGRGLVWLLSPGGELDEIESFRVPVREDSVSWGRTPRLAPLMDLIERSCPTGLILAGAETVRIAEWCGDSVHEPEDSLFDPDERTGWRAFEAHAPGLAVPGVDDVSDKQLQEKRLEDWRHRMYKEAGAAIAKRLPQLGWDRVVVMADPSMESQLVESLPSEVCDLIAAVRGINIHDLPTGQIAEHVAPVVEEVERERRAEAIRDMLDRARAGGKGTIGADETFAALAERRVQHLVLDCHGRIDGADAMGPEATETLEALDGGGLDPAEAAVHLALLCDAEVTQIDSDDWPDLQSAGGILSLLRF